MNRSLTFRRITQQLQNSERGGGVISLISLTVPEWSGMGIKIHSKGTRQVRTSVYRYYTLIISTVLQGLVNHLAYAFSAKERERGRVAEGEGRWRDGEIGREISVEREIDLMID